MEEHYSFDSQSLTYVKVEKRKAKKIKQVFLFVPLFLIIQLALLFFTYPVFKTENTRLLKRENEKLLDEYLVLQQKLQVAENQLNFLESRDDSLYREIFEISPVSSTMRRAGIGGTDRYSSLQNYENKDIMISTAARLDALLSKAKVQNESYNELWKVKKKRDARFKSMPALRPLAKKNSYLSSAYGYRLHPILGRYRMHKGIDIAAPKGTNVYAPGNGKVIEIKRKGGYGKEIVIDHSYGYTSRYAHLSKILVFKGQRVQRGEIIAKVGSTGLSTAPHLHYEIRVNNQAINPENYFYADIDPVDYLKWKKKNK